jgi:hypothetical protein
MGPLANRAFDRQIQAVRKLILFFAPRLHVVTGVWTAIKKKAHVKVDHGLLAQVLIQDNSMRFSDADLI